MQNVLQNSCEKTLPELRKLQLVELDLLKEFDKICKKNNLTYWLAYGTVLGAVRHGGFIPWDDDIDVCMPMADYKTFLKIAPSQLPGHILLCYRHKRSRYNKAFAKLMDRRTTLVETNDTLCDGEFRGVYLDIFPYIQYPAISENLTYFLIGQMMPLYCQRIAFQKISVGGFWCWVKVSLKLGLYKMIWAFLSLKKGAYMELIPEDNGYIKRVRRDDIFPLKPLSFEGLDFPAPHNPEAYLETIYKDYMTLPPIENRVPHYLFFSVETPYPHPQGMKK